MICFAIGVALYGPNHAVVRAGKLLLFLGASLLTVKGATSENRFPALLALRAFLVLCACNMAYALAIGETVFRADYLIEFSIYSGYTIAILVYLARPLLTTVDRIAAYGFLIFCGSTMGFLILVLAEMLGRPLRPRNLIGLATLTPIGAIALHFLMELRGKTMTLEYLAESDRGKLISTFFDTTLVTFAPLNWAFGLGVGAPLYRFMTPDSSFNGYLIRLGEGSVFSFCLHNEVLRVFCDFGLVGLALVIFRLWKVCSLPVIILLAVGMLTNSYLYSFSGALIASRLFNPPDEQLSPT